MNKQSNTYTVIYITIVVLVVGSLLAFTAMSLKSRQDENAAADKMTQILNSVHIATTSADVKHVYAEHIQRLLVVNTEGDIVKEGDATDSAILGINIAEQSGIKNPAERQLPVYICNTDNGLKYILPVAGRGLWGPIWGYVALDDDGSTIYGAYFSHEGETPGLGAEIEKPAFSDEFYGKKMFKDGKFLPIAVVKAGTKPVDERDYVDGISGGTITSKGVGAMLDNCLAPYEAYFKTLKK